MDSVEQPLNTLEKGDKKMGANGMYITLTEQNFQTEVVQTPQPVLVDF